MLITINGAMDASYSSVGPRLKEHLDSSIDSVATIISCSTHQRRIIDDILTLSKLDTSLLRISPSRVQPSAILKDILRMFGTDAQRAGVDLEIVQEVVHSNTRADWVVLDPGRMNQVTINLITNAIKFTQQEDRPKKVTVSMTMSRTRPSEDSCHVDFAPTSVIRDSVHDDVEWGTGDVVYLTITVKDTGCGLTPDQKAKIFNRFSQASPRTHTKYGGSGLGLFISRELVELQGGEIGVASESGVGSTFVSYKVTDIRRSVTNC